MSTAPGPAGQPVSVEEWVAQRLRVARYLVAGYLLLVVGATGFALLVDWTTLFGEGDGLEWIWLALFTLPAAAVVLALPVQGTWATVALIAGGCLQAGFAYALRRRTLLRLLH